MLLSQAMLKSAPEMTAKKGQQQQQQPRSSLSPEANGVPEAAGRKRSASLFLTSNPPQVGQHPRSQSIVQFEKGGRDQDKKFLDKTTGSNGAAEVRRKSSSGSSGRRASAMSSPPSTPVSPVFDQDKVEKQEKNTLRQMFQRMTTKNEAAAAQGAAFQVEYGETSLLCFSNDMTSETDCDLDTQVHPYTEDPTIAWEILKSNQPVKIVKPMHLETPINEERVRFVCISDTHSRSLDKLFIPDGDVLLIAGDFTSCGHPKEIVAFNNYLGTLPHKYKVVISGNHDLTFDSNWSPTQSVFPVLDKIFKNVDNKVQISRTVMQEALYQENVNNPRQLLTNCIYLEDSAVTLFGLKIYGTPWVPKFDGWAFNLPRGGPLLDKWNRIPTGIDVLLTHGPPLGYGDLTLSGARAGCVELLNAIRKRIRPKYHVFGHVHEGYGCTTDGYTKFINACTCDANMKPSNPPVLFDIALPHGYSKS